MNDKHHRVSLSCAALADVSAIVEYVASENPITAERLYKNLLSRVETLSRMPERGRKLPELKDQGIANVRELIVKPYRVVYRSTESAVCIIAVLDGRRDLDDLLLERLIRGIGPGSKR